MGYTIYAQHDPQWSDKQLGSAPGNFIGPYGCLLCSFAMIATSLGQTVRPDTLDTLFTINNVFISGDLLPDSALQDLAHKVPGSTPWQWLGTYAPGKGKLDPAQFHSEPRQAAILGMQLTDHFHFAPIVNWDGKLCLIADPWTGAVVDVNKQYGYGNLVKLIRYGIAQAPSIDRLALAKTLARQIVDL